MGPDCHGAVVFDPTRDVGLTHPTQIEHNTADCLTLEADFVPTATALTVIIPAHNEEAYIQDCLEALLAQSFEATVDVVLLANACSDNTAGQALRFKQAFRTRGWMLRVIRTRTPGKINALNCAEKLAGSQNRVYLDADVICGPDMLRQLSAVLELATPVYASGRMVIAPAQTWITQRYKTIWSRLPFMRSKAVGAGLFATNAAGRARWAAFPDIISDDTFVRLQFTAAERIEVAESFQWPLVEGYENLIKVRRRQDAGVREIDRLYPDLLAREEKPQGNLVALAARYPVSFLCYCLIRLKARTAPTQGDWTRGR